MLSVQLKACPLDYSKCNQTVTVYHKDGETITRTVFSNAFLDFRKNQNVDKTGSHESNSFLLVIPGENVALCNGDKVLLGVGAEVVDWTSFIPSRVSGLIVIKYVDSKYWGGKQCHVEAGG